MHPAGRQAEATYLGGRKITVLEGLLSTQAEQLYITLLRDAGASEVRDPDRLAEYGDAVPELLEKAFARMADDGHRLIPVEPRLAIQAAVLALERHMLDEHEACARAIAAMSALDNTQVLSPMAVEPGHLARGVAAEEAAHISVDIVAAAQREVMTFQMESGLGRSATGIPSKLRAAEKLRHRGVRMRCIFDTGYLASPRGQGVVERFTNDGFEVRAVHGLPGSMMLVDGTTALLPVDSRAVGGAVVVNDKTITDQLRSAFEVHWTRSVPLIEDGTPGDRAPSRMQRQILGMLAAGMKDESIARNLGVSLRTLRRSITGMSESAGVPTRFALAVVATRRGWIGAQAVDGLPARSGVERRAEDLAGRRTA
jgi:DNA-binding CsgD family transcriptional regulator